MKYCVYKKGIAVFILLLLITQVSIIHAKDMTELSESNIENFVERFITEKMHQHNIPGVAITIVKDRDTLLLKGYGYSNIDKGITVSPEVSVFRVASLAKALTAFGVLQLIEMGSLDLDLDVNYYLKQYKIEESFDEPITIRHLLTHTDGFEAHMIGIKTLDRNEIIPLGEFLNKNMASRFMPPGQMITYGNYATAVLGSIIEDVTDMEFAEYMEEYVFTPIGMNKSSFRQPLQQELEMNLITEYRYRSNNFRSLEGTYSHMVSSGGFYSTAEDMNKFIIALISNERFNGIKREMFRQQFSSVIGLPGVTFGLFEHYENNQRGLIRDGDSEGAQSRMFFLPEKDIGIFITYNSNDPILREQFITAFLDEFFPSLNSDITMSRGFENRIENIEGYYNFIQYSRNTFTKFIRLFTAVKVTRNLDNTIIITPMFEEPFGGLNEKTILVETSPYVFSAVNRPITIAFGEIEEPDKIYLFSGSGYHGSFEKLMWFENPYLHLSLFFAFLLIFVFLIIYRFKSRKKEIFVNEVIGKYMNLSFNWIIILNVSFALSIVPVLMLIGMKSYLPAYVQGVNSLMVIMFTIPIASFIVSLLLLSMSLYSFYKTKSQETLLYIGTSMISIMFLNFLNYWNLFGYKF